MFSETRYALSGDLRVAYRTASEGPRDIVFISNWFTNCEILPELPSMQGFIGGMAKIGRVVFFDQPGTGASDPVTFDSLPTLEQWSDSITAVLGDLKSEHAVLVAVDGAFATAALFAATHPGRTAALVVLEGFAGQLPIEGASEEQLEAFMAMWGTGELQHVLNPDMPWNDEVRAAWARQERLAASPKTARMMMSLIRQLNVRDVLPSIRVPTLVLHHADDPISPPAYGKDLADHIRGAKYFELPGRNNYLFVEPGWRPCVEEISEFLTGTRAVEDEDRALATVLFTDIVDSTTHAADMGDRHWRTALDAHNAVVRAQLSRHRGHEIRTTGDGFLATFDGPGRAVRCACAIRDAVRAIGIQVRVGLHTGEIELHGDDIGGIAVHITQRVQTHARPDEVLASGTVRDLVVGSGLQFDERGIHELKGVPGEWRLFAVAPSQR